jgi:hypothetical protein
LSSRRNADGTVGTFSRLRDDSGECDSTIPSGGPCSTAVTIRDLKEHLDGNPVIIKGTVHSPPPVGLKVIFL